jgi:hypothetical protein
MSTAPYSSFDPGGETSGVTQTLLDSKQDVLNVNGEPINTTVLDTFIIGGSEENNATKSLVTASALENWFEGIQTSFLTVLPGQSTGTRTGTINASAPSTTNVPSCSAVVTFVNTKLTPINTTIQFLLNNKVDQSLVVSSVTESNTSSSSIITEGALLNFIQSNPQLTTNGVDIVNVQPKLYARSFTETTDPSFNFIKSGVHDLTSGYDATKDNRLATMACTDIHITSKINSLVPTLISNSFASPTFTGTVTLPNPINILIQAGLGTSTLSDYLSDYIDGHTFSDGVDMTNIYLENSSYLQFPINVTGLGVLNSAENAYVPVFCQDVFIGGGPSGAGSSVQALINAKVSSPYLGFTIPTTVNNTNLGYLENVSSDIQQQFTTLTTSIINLDNTLTANISTVDNTITTRTFNPLILGNTTLYNINYSGVDTLGVTSNTANPVNRVLRPVVCSELYTGGTPTAIGTSLTSRLNLKVNTADTTPNVTQGDSKLVSSGGVYTHVAAEVTTLNTALANKHPLTGFDSAPTSSSNNFVTSGTVYNMFNNLDDARTHQTMYPSYLYTQLGTAQIEVWYGYPGINANNFGEIISSIGLNSTKFYQFGENPGLGSASYHTEYVPSIVYLGPSDASPLVLRNLTVNDNFMVRWSWVSYAPYTGSYTFRIGSDDGSRLQIRDSTSPSLSATTVVVMDDDQAYTTATGTFSMVAGRAYEYQLFWFEDAGGQRCTLEWQRPGDTGFSVFSPTAPCPDFNYFQSKFNVTKPSTGQYFITFGETCLPPSSNYTINLTIESITTGGAPGTAIDDYMFGYHTKTRSSFGVYVKEQDDGQADGTFRDARFDFICVSRGRIFCHGSVDGFTGVASVEYN